MAPAQRKRLLGKAPLKAFTPNTLTEINRLEDEIEHVIENGYAFDEEEYLPGLICIAVIAPNPRGKSNLGIAIQAPTMRMTRDKALQCLPALQHAASSISTIDQQAMQQANALARKL
jgi:DNA-binding IclR family transcriptional regulator